MTNLYLDALEKLADTATQVPELDAEWKYVRINPYELKQLITRQRELEALCKLQNEALNEITGTHRYAIKRAKALAAFDKFERGE